MAASPLILRASHTSTAPPARLWALLAGLESYGRWNPFTPRIVGSLAAGARLLLWARVGPLPFPMIEVVESVHPEREIVWCACWPLHLLHTRRVQRLEPTPEGGCTYTTEERFEGLCAPLVRLFASALVRRGFEATARAVCERAESEPAEFVHAKVA